MNVPLGPAPSNRLADLDISLIRQLSEGAEAEAVPLGIGEPTWDLPAPGRDILRQWTGRCPYGAGTGLPELRQAVAEFYRATFDETLITCGSVGALFSIMQAWVAPGDSVLIPDPGFVTYRNLVRFAGGIPVEYPLYEHNRYRLDPDQIFRWLDHHRIKMVILNHPSNPTGAFASPEALATVASACEKRGVILISDEVYRDLYLTAPPASLRDVSSYGIVISSVSKAWGAPGLRVGWAVGDPAILAPAATIHSYATTSPSYICQKAAAALIQNSEQILPQAREELSARWKAMHRGLADHFSIDAPAPDGAFYYLLKLPAHAHADPMAFAIRLRDEAKVVTIPGLAFGEGGRQYLRVSFAARPDQISEGISRIAPYWRETPGRP